MRTADIILRSGDRLPKIRRTVYVDGAVQSLTGATVTFTYQPVGGGAATVRTASVADAAGGIVEYAWAAGDASAAAGFYAAWFEVTLTSLVLSVPNDGFLLLQVVADGGAEWSYSGDPSARPLDAVRYLIGDTDPAQPKIRDAEILWAISEEPNKYLAAAACAETIAGQYAAIASRSRTVGDLSISEQNGSRCTEYRTLADRLRATAVRKGAPLARAGSTSSERQFTVGQMDNPQNLLPVTLGGSGLL